MPELPEVETIRADLEKNLVGRKITGVQFLWNGILKDTPQELFTKAVTGETIININRRAKNLDIELSNGLYLLFHMKMTGHLIYTDSYWKVDKNGKWEHHEGQKSPLYDPLNQYIRMIFSLDNGKILAFSDLRKFAYLKLLDKEGLEKAYKNYGPEPLSKDFSEEYFGKLLSQKKTAIKTVLMDQENIAGIGNIYADEILFESKVHPLQPANTIPIEKVSAMYQTIRNILAKAVKFRGTSTSDFRDTEGKKGGFGEVLKVYRRTGLPCPNDGTPIKRITVGGRGTHFCPKEQVLE
jgi:formamidopyrimidine-DNA glycosylase